MYFTIAPTKSDLQHHGILGMRWGVRRYQNKDGSLTSAGKKRYSAKDVQDAELRTSKYYIDASDKDLREAKAIAKGDYGAYRNYVSDILTGEDVSYFDKAVKSEGYEDFEDYIKQTHDDFDMRKSFDDLFTKKGPDGKLPIDTMLSDAQRWSDAHHEAYDKIAKMPVANMTYKEAVNEIARIRQEERRKVIG